MRSDDDELTPDTIRAVVPDTFDHGAEAIALRQAEAREAWANGKQLVEGAYYRHHRYGETRRIVKFDGPNIHWADKYGLSNCLRASFLEKVSGRSERLTARGVGEWSARYLGANASVGALPN
jgi:hypothetical protein